MVYSYTKRDIERESESCFWRHRNSSTLDAQPNFDDIYIF